MQRRTADEEISDLKQEIDAFQNEKERVRAILGQIGGMPDMNTHVLNIVFTVFLVSCFIVSLLSHGVLRLLMIEFAIVALSFKVLYLIHSQTRVNHFQLWILSSMEWRVNELIKKVNDIRDQFPKDTNKEDE